MIWLFAFGIIVLMVLSPGFRRFGLWCLGIATALFILLFLYNESTKDPLSAKRARLAQCVLAMPGGMSMPYGGDSYQWNERQLDRGIELCEADLAAYHARQEQETNAKLGLQP